MRITGWKAGDDIEGKTFLFLSESSVKEPSVKTPAVKKQSVVEQSVSSVNWTTMVIGRNGTKKSLLLRALMDGFLGHEDFRHGIRPAVPVRVEFDFAKSRKGRVVAVSGTPFDRFPRQSRYVVQATTNKYDSLSGYYYMGLGAANGSIGTTHGVRTLAHLLFQMSDDDPGVASSVKCVLDFLGFERGVMVVLKRNPLINFTKKDASEFEGAVAGKFSFEKFKNLIEEKSTDESDKQLANALRAILRKVRLKKYRADLIYSLERLPSAVDFEFSEEGVFYIFEPTKINISFDDIVSLLQSGILIASHIACRRTVIESSELSKVAETTELESKRESEPEPQPGKSETPKKKGAILAETDMSSGQWQLLSSMLGLALTVTDNSLIVIDEPENSLHPDWQRSYVQLLEEVIEHRKGCHAVIATHSPLIASGVDGNRGNAIRMVRTQSLLGSSEPLQIAFGWDASDVYNEIFGLPAPRASRFTAAADRALELLRDNIVDTEELPKLLEELTEAAKSFPDTDSMRQVVSAMAKAFKALSAR